MELADKTVVEVRLSRRDIPCDNVHGKVEVQVIELFYAQSLAVHQHLVEVLDGGFVRFPHIRNHLHVAVVLHEIGEERICLIAMPFMREGIVVAVLENVARSAHGEVFVRERLKSLPVGGRFPDGSSHSHGTVETRVAVADCSLTAVLRIAHIMEGVSHLMCHRTAHRLACSRIEPKGRHLEVVATSIASPLFGMVEQHHDFVLCHIGINGVNKSQLIDFQVVVFFQLLLHEVEVEVVEIALRQFVGSCAAPPFIPKDDEVVGFYRATLRPCIFVVGVVLGIEQRVGWPRIAPFVRDIDFLLCKRNC